MNIQEVIDKNGNVTFGQLSEAVRKALAYPKPLKSAYSTLAELDDLVINFEQWANDAATECRTVIWKYQSTHNLE